MNYTFSDSESPTFNDFDENLPIPGVAKHAFNAQIYYENSLLEGRLSYTWRDDSFVGNFGFGDGASGGRSLGRWLSSYGQLDAQAVVHITEYLDLTAEALNITEEDQSEYLQFEELPFRFTSGSRRILLGARYRF